MADYAEIVTQDCVTASGTINNEEILLPQYESGMVPVLWAVEVEHPHMGELDAKYSEWVLETKKNSAATASALDESSVIAKGKRWVCTNSTTIEDVVEKQTFFPPIPITSPKLYFSAIQDTGSGHTYRVRLHITPRKIYGLTQRTVQNVAQF